MSRLEAKAPKALASLRAVSHNGYYVNSLPYKMILRGREAIQFNASRLTLTDNTGINHLGGEYLLQNVKGKKMMVRTKLFIFNTLFPALLNQDIAIGSDKCRIFTGKTAV